MKERGKEQYDRSNGIYDEPSLIILSNTKKTIFFLFFNFYRQKMFFVKLKIRTMLDTCVE